MTLQDYLKNQISIGKAKVSDVNIFSNAWTSRYGTPKFSIGYGSNLGFSGVS
jgi:hypothetical protein